MTQWLQAPTAILFDFDYTLVDSSAGIAECINFGLTQMGLADAAADDIHIAVRASLRDAFCTLAGAEHSHRYDEFFALFVQRADAVMVDRTQLFPGVLEAIRSLASSGYDLGIVSSKHRPHIEPVLIRENLHASFAVVIGGADVSQPKPHPDGIRQALSALGTPSASALYVGDSISDAKAAHRAGVRFVAVLSGPTPATAFDSTPAHDILPAVTGLPTWLSQLASE
jgi:phosphoglycolate phosphatase